MICAIRKHLGGCSRHMVGQLKKGKAYIVIYYELEAFAEVRPLSTQEIELKTQSNAEMAGLLREEELK